MPKVSRIKLDKDLQTALLSQFWESLSKINSATESSQFFSDLLTETEEIMLSKRLAAAILLVRGKTATEIRDSIHLSYTTTGSVAAWVKNAKPKTREILLRFSKEKDWESIIDKIDALLDKLPPGYGKSWSDAGKRKHKKNLKRSIHRNLR